MGALTRQRHHRKSVCASQPHDHVAAFSRNPTRFNGSRHRPSEVRRAKETKVSDTPDEGETPRKSSYLDPRLSRPIRTPYLFATFFQFSRTCVANTPRRHQNSEISDHRRVGLGSTCTSRYSDSVCTNRLLQQAKAPNIPSGCINLLPLQLEGYLRLETYVIPAQRPRWDPKSPRSRCMYCTEYVLALRYMEPLRRLKQL